FSWHGGDTYIDNPTVRVEHKVNGSWTSYADQTGEVQTMGKLKPGPLATVTKLVSPEGYGWSANLEAADYFPPNTHRRGPGVPDGQYRFVVDGMEWHGKASPYHLVSRTFTVSPWKGVKVAGIAVDANGAVAVRVGPVTYPRTYASAFPFVKDDKGNP